MDSKGVKNKTVSLLSRKDCWVLGAQEVVILKKGTVRRAKNLIRQRGVYEIQPNIQEWCLEDCKNYNTE